MHAKSHKVASRRIVAVWETGPRSASVGINKKREQAFRVSGGGCGCGNIRNGKLTTLLSWKLCKFKELAQQLFALAVGWGTGRLACNSHTYASANG